MQKILELTEKEFATGIAPSSQVQDKGLWHKAKGINFAGDIFGESNTSGLLQAGPALTDLTASVILDRPFAWTADVLNLSNEYVYIWGDAGYLYRLDLTSNTITRLNPTSGMGSAANGLFIVNH